MKYLIVKVKDRNLFFNVDEVEGCYICDTPMLMDKEQANTIINYCDDICNFDTNEIFKKDQFEIKEVELTIL